MNTSENNDQENVKDDDLVEYSNAEKEEKIKLISKRKKEYISSKLLFELTCRGAHD